MFYRKIELCIVRMGDNDMRTACTLEQEMVDHSGVSRGGAQGARAPP